MKTGLMTQMAAAALTVGVVVTVFGLMLDSTSTYALWQASESTTAQTLTAGRVGLSVTERDAETDAAGVAGTSRPDGGVALALPSRILADLAPGAPQAVLLDVRAVSEGNRGLRYSMPVAATGHSTVSGDTTLTRAVTMVVSVVTAAARADCKPNAETVGTELYSGPLAGATMGARQIVAADYRVADGAEYLCLQFELPDGYGDYANVGTVTGTSVQGDVSAETRWYGTITPSAAARQATVSLIFMKETFRP